MTEINPQACSKRDVAHLLGYELSELDRLVREGLPCKPSRKGRSPLVFNVPQVVRWLQVHNARQTLDDAEIKLAEAEVQIWDLSLELELGKREADQILGRA